MKRVEEQDAKQLQIELLKYAKEICVENDIKYYLAYGTLLGAVRHKGYIPWDDDIDIVLFRDEYEKFIKAVEEDNHEYIKVIHKGNSDCYYGPYAMLVDARTGLNHYKVKPEILKELGVYIDVFPLDELADMKQAKKILPRVYKLKALNNLTLVKDFSSEMGLKAVAKKIVAPFARAIGHERLCAKIESFAHVCRKGKGTYVADIMWDPRMPWCIPKEYYDETILLEFEGEMFHAPKRYDEILTQIYGDYMQFPPEDERDSGHHNDFYWRE